MRALTTDTVPASLRAGDTFQADYTLPDHMPADGWLLRWALVNPRLSVKLLGTAQGDAHRIRLSQALSATLLPGLYSVQAHVQRGTDDEAERQTLLVWQLDVAADLAAAAAAGLDARSHARRVLDNINAWLEGRAEFAGEFQLGERRIRQYPIDELLKLRSTYQSEVIREERKAKGLGGMHTVRVSL